MFHLSEDAFGDLASLQHQPAIRMQGAAVINPHYGLPLHLKGNHMTATAASTGTNTAQASGNAAEDSLWCAGGGGWVKACVMLWVDEQPQPSEQSV